MTRCEWCREIFKGRRDGPTVCPKCWTNRENEAYLDSLPPRYPARKTDGKG